MLDIKFIRENPDAVKKACKNRGAEINIDSILKLDKSYRESLQKAEKLKHQRNIINQEINKLKKAGKSAAASPGLV